MDPVLAALVLVSAALHPLWNALIKRDPRPEGAFLGVMVLLALLGGAHSMVAGYDLLAARHVWPLIAVSWAGLTVYATCMVVTLRRGDLSAYYPIIRSSPLFIVAAGTLAAWRTTRSPFTSTSPAMIAAAMGEAPRQRGKSDGCTLRTPRGGIASTCGTISWP